MPVDIILLEKGTLKKATHLLGLGSNKNINNDGSKSLWTIIRFINALRIERECSVKTS